jgi:predicted ATP-dependent serine protease
MGLSGDLVDKTVTCKDCGAIHAHYLKNCPRCSVIENKQDAIVNNVLNSYKSRSEIGIRKYGTTLADNPINVLEWLQHLQEELMDATLYIEKLKSEINASKT